MKPERIAAPTPPEPPQPYSFPVMATVAPVAVSVALWLVTGSVFALVFAALGPAVAVASLVDARIHSRRRRRRERVRFASELDTARREIGEAHERERSALESSAPSARRLIGAAWPESEQWLADLRDPVLVGVGAGRRESSLIFDGLPTASRSRGGADRVVRELAEHARTVDLAPVAVDARLGVGIAGAPAVAEAVLRALMLQLVASLPPVAYRVEIEAPADRLERWSWVGALPHETTVGAAAPGECTRVRVARTGSEPVPGPDAAPVHATRSVTLAAAARREALPRSARIVIGADGATGSIVQHPEPGREGVLRLEHASIEQSRAVAATLDAHAVRGGLTAASTLPEQLAFSDLPGDGGQSPPRGLDCAVAVTAAGALALDLVAQGPHAVVGGTTGSGKSELLTAWVLAMARSHPPSRANVLLVDFKGGSAFASLAALPHCVGVITDLDEAGAGRALESLSAELRRRERRLASVGAKSIDGLDDGQPGAMPRLVIVVDEFAAMVAGFPDLHALFADIAARGRSLGVHLVLCTQRPAGVIRDAVLANSALRLSLRVNNRSDSTAVIGSDVASALPAHPRGRAYVSADGAAPELAQFPLVTPPDIAAVEARWSGEDYRPHRPWLDPLPGDIPLEPLVEASVGQGSGGSGGSGRDAGDVSLPFGVLDDPGTQSQPVARYRPAADGNLLVVGGAGSGKSTLLDSLECAAEAEGAAVNRLPADIEAAWDSLVALVAGLRTQRTASRPSAAERPGAPATRLVLVDDLDQLLGRFPEEYESAVPELLARAMREGPARGVRFVVTTQRLTSALHQLGSLCGSRLLLRLPNRQEHVSAGGDGQDFVERALPGSGRWNGLAVQVARPRPDGRADPAGGASEAPRHSARGLDASGGRRPRSAVVVDDARPLAIVSTRPGEFVERLRRALPAYARPGAVVEVAASPNPGVVVSSGTRPSAVVGDPDAWQARWGALQAARPAHTVVLDGVGVSEFRAVTRLRTLPPPLSGDDVFWVWGADGSVRRGRLPQQGESPPSEASRPTIP